HGQTKETLGYNINAVIDNIVLHSHETITQRQEAVRAKIARIAGGGGDFIGGDLFDDENVIRLVLVETANHVIAIAPGERVIWVFALTPHHAFRVAVAGHVQPMTPPAFAVMGGSEQAIYNFRKRL